MMAGGWWVYGLGYEIMFMRHVDALSIAICKLCFIFCRTALRIRNTRQTMSTYRTVTQPTPALPHPLFRTNPIRFVYCLANVFISVCGRLIIFVSFAVHTFANCRAKFNYDSLK